MLRLLLLLFVSSSTLLPGVAEACTVCGAAADNKNAFIGMTAFMTLTPLIFIGSVLYWLKTRAAELAHLDDSSKPLR